MPPPIMHLRSAHAQDIDFIVAQEARSDFQNFIGRWSREEHTANLQDADQQYLVVEEAGVIGYAILKGLQSANRSIELARFVISQPGRGFGRKALCQLITLAFEQHHAHRFWLDVFPHNARARHLYESIGFQVEGTLRDVEKRGEAYYSLIIMSMLEAEYRSLFLHEDSADFRLADHCR
ncbi:GNAT family N-acetyltransferase [Leptolyngbya sp. FACHB-1515]|uniref:GNAT family N-acetyltransferase n=1 Tax=Leptolyngbya sp. FACHB-1515 TaxID=2933931 RepID=UPI0032973A08